MPILLTIPPAPRHSATVGTQLLLNKLITQYRKQERLGYVKEQACYAREAAIYFPGWSQEITCKMMER